MRATATPGGAPQPARVVRVAATADLHGYLPEIPRCDLLLVAGDLCPVADHDLGYQRQWLLGPFSDWLESVPAGAIAGIAGNHDFVAENDPVLMRGLPWTYLSDQAAELAGLLVYGSPWTPTFGDWAFMSDDASLAARWAKIPAAVEVLVTHGPPCGAGDLTVSGAHAGSATLRDRLPELSRLRLHVFGHIHEAGGDRTEQGRAEIANVSHVDFEYQPVLPAVGFDL